jgi:hypothetical protein
MNKGFMIHYMSTSPAGINFDREWLESQSYEYVEFMYNKCLQAEEKMIGNLEL